MKPPGPRWLIAALVLRVGDGLVPTLPRSPSRSCASMSMLLPLFPKTVDDIAREAAGACADMARAGQDGSRFLVDIRLPALARDAEDGARAAQEDPLLLDIVGKMAATWAMRGSGRVRVALNSVVVAAAARNSLAASPNGPGSSGSSSQGESSGAAPPGRRASASSFPANAAATAASAAATAGRGIDGRRRLGRSAAVRPDVRVVALDAGAAAQAGDDLLVLVRPNNAREHGKLEAVQIAAARAGGLHVPVVLVNPELSCYHGRHETLFRPNLLADFRTCFHLDLAAARYDRRRSVAVLRRYPRAYELYFKDDLQPELGWVYFGVDPDLPSEARLKERLRSSGLVDDRPPELEPRCP